jgi:hypothetical protein
MCGRDGLGGAALSAAFGQDKAADTLRPGPVLAALTEQAASDLAALSDDQLMGTLSAAGEPGRLPANRRDRGIRPPPRGAA